MALRGVAGRSRVHVIPCGCTGPAGAGIGAGASIERLAILFGVRYTHTGYQIKDNFALDAEKDKLLQRLNRIRGQVEALRRALEAEASSTAVLQQATACRGALDGFIAEVIEDHIRERVLEAADKTSATQAAEELIGIVHSYLT
jgi:FrmR/RcnR family transcriptional regulator, repressor of frmRAB operon